jgi:hypothetical protein
MEVAEQLDAAVPGAGVKRARDEAAPSAAASASASASASPEAVPAALLRTPAPASAPAPLVRLSHAEHFNVPLLKFYYQHLFPFKQMTRWLSYGNGASALPVSCSTTPPVRPGSPARSPARAAPPMLRLPL